MTHFLTAALALAASCVAPVAAVGSSATLGGVLLDFQIKRGDSYGSLSLDNRPYLYRRDGDVALTLGNEVNMYVGTLEVGSDNQQNTIQVDTGSSDLWFMAKNVQCFVPSQQKREAKRDIFGSFLIETTIFGGIQTNDATEPPIGIATATGTEAGDIAPTNTCVDYGSFDTSLSSSFKRNESAPAFYITYGDGTGASGIWGQDTVKLSGTTLDSVSFAVANESTTNLGILGIGLEGLESTNTYEYQNFPVLLKQQGAINKVAYSLYLNAVNATTGSVLFGAVDHAKYSGTLQTVPVLDQLEQNPYSFNVMVDGITVGDSKHDYTITSNSYAALLDSGTSLVVLPTSLFQRFGELLGGQYSQNLGYFVVDCPTNNNNINITFNLSGAKISVPYSNFILTTAAGNTEECYLGIQAQDDVDYMILGDNFLSSAYLVYDLEDLTISVAQAKYTDESDIEVISSSIPSATQASLYSSTSVRTGITESSVELVFSYSTGLFTPPDITPETGIFSASETEGGAATGTGSGTGTGSKSSGSKSGSTSTSTSSTTKSSGEAKAINYSLASNFIISAFGLLVFIAI